MHRTEPAAESETAERIEEGFITRILDPYFERCRYLRSAEVYFDPVKRNGHLPARLRATGQFSIPESCYIQDTGHFNAVEFVMCFNQLGYVLLAHVLRRGLLTCAKDWDAESFAERQLPDVLILKTSAQFRRAINARNFFADVAWTKASTRSNHVFGSFDVSFSDAERGASQGEVLCCVLNLHRAEPAQMGLVTHV